MEISEKEAKLRTQKNKRASILKYRQDAGVLFKKKRNGRDKAGCCLVVNDLQERFELGADELAHGIVNVEFVKPNEVWMSVFSLCLPTFIEYDTFACVKDEIESGEFEIGEPGNWIASFSEFRPKVCCQVRALQEAIHKYCKEAAFLANCVHSDTLNDWCFAYQSIEANTLSLCGSRINYSDEELDRIGNILIKLPAVLKTDAEMYGQDQCKSEKAKTVSRFRGRMLKRKDGGWVRVEDDGVTFTCPTKRGDEVKEESYRMDKPAQLEFLDALLDRFEKNMWHKPSMKKPQWQNNLFKRGPAAQFLKDGHIACWVLAEDGRENQGEKGAIRLVVPVTHAKASGN